jgi:transketolase
MGVEPLTQKWQAFGWNTMIIDGHDYEQILRGLQVGCESKEPFILLCQTIKGKGVSFMENDPLWHSRDLPADLFEKAIMELGIG